jgi:ANTAR domain
MTIIQDAAAAASGDADEDGAGGLVFWRDRAAQLQHALDSRIVIEQAKGVLAERLGCDVGTAFDVLRHAARSTRRSIHELSAEVVAVPVTPSSVAAAYTARRLRRDAPQLKAAP